MPTCAFLTIADREGWFIDDDLVHPPLKALGWSVEEVAWNAAIDWSRYDLVVIRSPWDYQHHVENFLDVLRAIQEAGIPLENSLRTVSWNVDKQYLLRLREQSVKIVPTLSGERPSVNWLQNAWEQLDSQEIVIKPTIGATADDAFRLRRQMVESELEEVCNVFVNKACLVQPFMKSIADEGEYSLMFFNGELSHTVLKTVKSGDFRVQEEHGGGVVAIPNPPPELVTTANGIMSCLQEVPLYARVDLIRGPDEDFLLMELELIEPCLYFRFDPEAPMRFAKAVNKRYLRSVAKTESGAPE